MTDLLTRLRQLARAEHDDLDIGDEAAEEIINLRTDVHVLQELLERHKRDAAIEADRKRRGEPVDIRQEVIETLEMILAADWRKWEELASPDEFVRWAKSRANYALSIINEAPQPAEPLSSNPGALSSKSAEPTDKDFLLVAEPAQVPSDEEIKKDAARYRALRDVPEGDGAGRPAITAWVPVVQGRRELMQLAGDDADRALDAVIAGSYAWAEAGAKMGPLAAKT